MSESRGSEKSCISSALAALKVDDVDYNKLDVPSPHATQDHLSAGNASMHSVLGASLSDLPPNVMTMIFQKLDSVARKKIERVCNEWQKNLQAVKNFRSHIRIEAPALVGSMEIKTYWRKAASNLINPDLEVFQLDGMDIPDLSFEFENPDIIFCYSGIECIRSVLEENGADSSKVEIIMDKCKTEYHLDGWTSENKAGKVRITRSEITAIWMEGLHIGTLFFEELWLDASDADQVSRLFLEESGPMTRNRRIHWLRSEAAGCTTTGKLIWMELLNWLLFSKDYFILEAKSTGSML